MDLTEIINKSISLPKPNYLIIPHNFIWDSIIFNLHFQMIWAILGVWAIQELFDLLFWADWRILRRKIKEKILKIFKR